MKTVILAGGFGSRLSEYTGSIPKPLVPIGADPILIHIMRQYAKYGYNEFIIAAGYKASVIKEYFANFRNQIDDFTIDLHTGVKTVHSTNSLDWKVSIIDTGVDTMTGGRVSKLKDYIGDDDFFLTYGDGVSDINIDQLLKFHKTHQKILTLTAVYPPARFGVLELEGSQVVSFKEKNQLSEGRINGGFFVCKPELIDYIEDPTEMLERQPFDRLTNRGQIEAFLHNGFWQCMDSKKDYDNLNRMVKQGNAPWL